MLQIQLSMFTDLKGETGLKFEELLILLCLDFDLLCTFYFYAQMLSISLNDGLLFIIIYYQRIQVFITIIFKPIKFINFQLLDYTQKSSQRSMRKSCHQQNRKMLQAYQLFQSGQLSQSVRIYQSLLDRTNCPEIRYNLICTVSVISITVGNYNYALQILQENICGVLNEIEQVSFLVKIRYMANMCFLQMFMGLFEQAVEIFKRVKQIVRNQSAGSSEQIIQFLMRLFFRVESVNEIQQEIDSQGKTSLIQAFYMLNIALARQFMGYPHSQKLLKLAYPIFVSHNKYHLAVACIRQLLLLPLCHKQITKYQKQLSKIISMDLMQNYQLDNRLSIQCCKYIAQELVKLIGEIQVSKKECHSQDDNFLWTLVLKYQTTKLRSVGLQQQEKAAIKQNIDMMLQEKDSLIIKQMQKTDFYISAQRQIKQILTSFSQTYESIVNLELRMCWKKIQNFSHKPKTQMVRNKSQSQMNSRLNREQKENNLQIIPISTMARDRSSKSLIDEGKKSKIKQQSHQQLSPARCSQRLNNQQKDNIQSKALYKVIKFCEYGSFLNKRNFNSDGGQYRFVRVTQSVLKWAKNPDKIEESHQMYPLKDIKSIVYGKCTPTLLKQTNHLLKEQFCFSLNLRKRTLDFYCKDFEQTTNWILGLGYKLKQIHPNFRQYNKGRLLWKKMFMILRQNFTKDLKNHERKFYFQTAHAIILFGKNGCKINNK